MYDQNNTKLFIDYFIKIENELGKYLDNHQKTDNYVDFSKKLSVARGKSAKINNYFDSLKEFASMRNFFSHSPKRALAIPSEETIKEIKQIYENITNAKTAMDIANRNVIRFSTSDNLFVVLKTIREKKYSQFPVYNSNKEFEGLLTENGITQWLSEKIEDDIISIEETFLNEILNKDEKKKNYAFINREADIFDIQDMFKKTNTEALFVTHSGNKQQNILGIITAWDITMIG